jgi:hypothetical protein
MGILWWEVLEFGQEPFQGMDLIKLAGDVSKGAR